MFVKLDAASSALDLVDLTTLTLGRATRSARAVSDEVVRAGARFLNFLGRRQILGILRHQLRPDTRWGRSQNTQSAPPNCEFGVNTDCHALPRPHSTCRLARLPIDLDVPPFNRIQRKPACFEGPHRPQPYIKSHPDYVAPLIQRSPRWNNSIATPKLCCAITAL